MTVQTAAGSVISIGTTASDHLVDSYTAIGEVVTIPEFGRVYNLVTHNPIAARNTTKIKGSFNDGSVALDIGKDPNDAGQAAALVARESDLAYNFKLELNDAGPGTDDTPTTYYFTGKVMSYTTNLGSVDSVIGSTLTVEIDTEHATVPAS